MKIKSMSVQGIQAFCDKCEFEGFGLLNLFIGQNGIGKTNAMQLLSTLPKQKLDYRDVQNRESRDFKMERFLRVEFEQPDKSFEYSAVDFESVDSSYPDELLMVDYSITDPTEQLVQLEYCDQVLLQFVVSYVLKDQYRFDDGSFKRERDQFTYYDWTNDTNTLPSSAFSLIKLFLGLFSNPGSEVVFFDEPERHLEPKSIRRLFDVLVWLISTANQNSCCFTKEICCKKIDGFFSNQLKSCGFQKRPNEAMSFNQFFIASHSSVFINCFLSLQPDAAIYRFYEKDVEHTEFQYDDGQLVHKRQPTFRLTTRVEQVWDGGHSLLDELGALGADLLQCNGIIWVEGPSDALYIQKWLEMYAVEKGLPIFRRHHDFAFQMTAGGCLRYYFFSAKVSVEESVEKLFSMLRVSRNAFLVMDSDAFRNEQDEVDSYATFEDAKDAMLLEQEKHAKQGFKYGFWFRKGDTDSRTIESYMDDASLKITLKNKMEQARRRIHSWGGDKKLSEFNHGLECEVKKIYECIKSWQ